MPVASSDAFVFFGATGDLAYKKIFPALQALIKRGALSVPIIGVSRGGWSLDKLRERARASLEKYGPLDAAAFAKLSAQLRFVDGNYEDPRTYARLKEALGGATRPIHYLAIPPSSYGVVVQGLATAGCAGRRARHRRKTVRPRSDLRAGAQPDAARRVPRVRGIPHRPLSRQGGGAEPAVLSLRQHVSRADLESQLCRERPDHDGRRFRRRGSRQLL